MRTCLVYPNFRGELVPSLGLAALATHVNRKHEVKLLDVTFHAHDWKEYLRNSVGRFKPGVVGFSCLTFNFQKALEFAAYLKAHFPGIKVIFGGIHPTLMPDETISHQQVDAVCLGDGEETLTEYLDRVEAGEALDGLLGLWFKDDEGNVHRNPPRPLLGDLDSLPFVDWSLWDIKRYVDNPAVRGELPLMFSRGCPYRCSFCSNEALEASTEGRYYRTMSPYRAIAEIKHQIAVLGPVVKGFYFWDDVFFLNPRQFRQFCELYVAEGLHVKYPWTCNTRVNLVTDDWAATAYRAGCYKVRLGVEAGNDAIRNLVLEKGISTEQVRRAREVLKRHDLLVRFNVILGSPGETLRTMRESVRLVRELKPETFFFSIFQPLPRTKVLRLLPRLCGATDDEKWKRNFNFWQKSLVSTKWLGSKDVERFRNRVLLRIALQFALKGLAARRVGFLRDVVRFVGRDRVRFALNAWMLAVVTLHNYEKEAWLERRRAWLAKQGARSRAAPVPGQILRKAGR
ncbi:MAG: hypothetical protein Kow0069_29630 [Promethearchaeota archaeon]